MRIGVLTAGGDAPGLNAALRAIGRSVLTQGHQLIGISDGWAGLAREFQGREMTRADLAGILAIGGTTLGSIRYSLDNPADGRERVLWAIGENLDALVAIGGDGTLSIASWLAERGAPVVGVGKTLDNDLANTDYCIGFDTAVSVVADALDRLHTTAASHHRVLVLETMGRNTGWVATMGGLAGGADFIVIPEVPVTLNDIVTHVQSRHGRGSSFSIVVVAEGVSPEQLGGHSATERVDSLGRSVLGARGVGQFIADHIAAATGFETRCTVLGYLQRGGSPSALDRIWATRVGAAAADLVMARQFGMMPTVRCGEVATMPLADSISEAHGVPDHLYRLAQRFF
jgi:6-phosphofructokinase 1